jgi:DNA-binding response OmpR family regulator
MQQWPGADLGKQNLVLHVCVVGRLVARNRDLVEALRAHHQVTLVDRIEWLDEGALLGIVDVLVMDCSGDNRGVLSNVVHRIRRHQPQLQVVLVDGGLSQQDIALGFGAGVADYFPEPCDVALLTERIAVLGDRKGFHKRPHCRVTKRRHES